MLFRAFGQKGRHAAGVHFKAGSAHVGPHFAHLPRRRPLLAFPRQPVGVGDLTSGLFLARVLLGDSWVQAFEFTAAAVHEVLLETQACSSYELQLVRAQDRIAHPRVRFEAQLLAL